MRKMLNDKKDWLDYGMMGSLIILSILLVVIVGYGLNHITKEKLNTTYTVVHDAYTPCEKGYCSMDGFECLDTPKNAYNMDDCYCTQEGYVCKS